MAMMTMISEPRRPRAVRRCGRFLHMSHAAWSLCVLYTRMSCAETDEPIEMLPADSCGSKKRCNRCSADPPCAGSAEGHVPPTQYSTRTLAASCPSLWIRAAALRPYSKLFWTLVAVVRSAYVPRGGGKWTAVGAT